MGTELALADPRTMTPAERKEMYDLLLADVENLDDAKLAMLEALELAMDTDKVTAFPKAEIVHQGTPGISVGGELLRELDAVVLAHEPRRGLFAKDQKPPVCSSLDGHTPTGGPVQIELLDGRPAATGPTCAVCPMNAWGSVAAWKQEAGGEGSSKACTEKRLLGLLIKGRDIPVLLFVPPTSLRAWAQHTADMRLRKAALAGHYTRIRVEKEEAGERIWGSLRFAPGDAVNAEDRRTVFALKRALMGTLEQTDIQVDQEGVAAVDEHGRPVEAEYHEPAEDVPPAEEPPPES